MLRPDVAGVLLCVLLPSDYLALTFFLGFYHNREEKRRAGIFAAAPMKPFVHELLRCAAVISASLLLVILAILPALLFYGFVFGCCPVGMTAAVASVTLLPLVVFALGSGRLLAHAGLPFLYAWMIVPFVLRAIPLPEALGLLNGTLFTERPLELGVLDPGFSLSAGSIATACALFVLGPVFALVRVPGKRQ